MIIAVSLALVTVVIDFYALTVALPSIADDFHERPASLHWIVTAYLLAFASLTIVGGRLGDAFGRRRILILGVAIFCVASIGAGLAPTVEATVLFRALQGTGAALLFPVGLAALSQAFPAGRRAWAVGLVMGVTSIGTALGPFVGGVLTQAAVWRLVFLVNVPICIAAVVMVRYAFEETRVPGGTARIDPLGCVTLTAALVALTVGVDRAHVYPLAATVALFVGGVVLFGAFVLVERRSRAPLVDMGLVRTPGFGWILTSGCLGNFGWALAVFGATLYMQRVEGYDPIEAGTAFLAMSAGAALGGPLAGRLVPRRGAGMVLVGVAGNRRRRAAVALDGVAGLVVHPGPLLHRPLHGDGLQRDQHRHDGARADLRDRRGVGHHDHRADHRGGHRGQHRRADHRLGPAG